MIKNKKSRATGLELDLTGPQGNAFFLLGTARNLAAQLGWSPAEQRDLLAEMQSADYEHLVQTFDRNFGDFVTLYR